MNTPTPTVRERARNEIGEIVGDILFAKNEKDQQDAYKELEKTVNSIITQAQEERDTYWKSQEMGVATDCAEHERSAYKEGFETAKQKCLDILPIRFKVKKAVDELGRTVSLSEILDIRESIGWNAYEERARTAISEVTIN